MNKDKNELVHFSDILDFIRQKKLILIIISAIVSILLVSVFIFKTVISPYSGIKKQFSIKTVLLPENVRSIINQKELTRIYANYFKDGSSDTFIKNYYLNSDDGFDSTSSTITFHFVSDEFSKVLIMSEVLSSDQIDTLGDALLDDFELYCHDKVDDFVTQRMQTIKEIIPDSLNEIFSSDKFEFTDILDNIDGKLYISTLDEYINLKIFLETNELPSFQIFKRDRVVHEFNVSYVNIIVILIAAVFIIISATVISSAIKTYKKTKG